MNFIFRWRLLISVLNVLRLRYGPESANAVGRFRSTNLNDSWVDFTKRLRPLKLDKELNTAVGLLWLAIHAPTKDRLGYRLKLAAYHSYNATYVDILEQADVSGRKNLRMAKIIELNKVAEKLGLPSDYSPADEDLGYDS